ncbi:MAG: copper resistance protein CopC [Thermomicrobiales bacterium]|nr:copper resistance protein CopC [Thermomicrobiales bacterium]
MAGIRVKAGFESMRRHGVCLPVALAVFIILSILSVSTGMEVSAHAEIERTTPAQDSILAAPPENLQFWFTERISTDPSPPTIIVFDEDGNQLETTALTIDPNDPRHLTVEVSGFSTGTYTVSWTVQSADDGHTLSGTYGFRIGTGRAPGAATVSGEQPAPWAVALRWLTFLGAGAAAAGLLWIAFSALVDSDRQHARRGAVAMAGAVLALGATVLEPILQSQFPPEGVTKPSLSEAVAGLPNPWWLRPAGLAVAIGALAVMHFYRNKPVWKPIGILGSLGALAALLGLALTTHVAAREEWNLAGKLSASLHELSVGLWAGGLLLLAFAWPRGVEEGEGTTGKDAVRQFSRIATVLAPIGILTGIVNSGLVLPSLDSLWESTWGKVLIGKVVILVPVMVLAARHHLWLRKHLERLGSALRSTVRLETALIAAVVLGGSILALSAPPSKSTGEVTSIDLAAPLTGNEQAAEAVHLIMSPMRAGQNEIRVNVGLISPEGGGEVIPVERVRLDLISLNHEADIRDLELVQDPETGDFVSEGIQLTLNGWWEIDVLVRRAGLEDQVVPFFVLIPDPNINGFDAPSFDGTSADAEQLFEQGLQDLTGLETVHYTERLASGLGGVAISERTVNSGADGSEPSSLQTTSSIELLTIGDRTWQRPPGGEWIERTSIPVFPPSQWGDTYEGAQDFQLGRRVMVGDRIARVITFYVPETDSQIAAWYAWWIDEETGHLLNEAMVSRLHYMRWRFFDFNEPVRLLPPDTSATPQASPPASPVSADGTPPAA